MKKSLLTVFSGLILIMAGCSPSRDKVAGEIQQMEQSLFSPESASFNKQKADSLLSMYVSFIREHPKDSLSPVYLFKAANIAMNSEDGPRALNLFDQYLKDYPDQPKASLCLFFKAFIYENLIRNLDKARETYLIFIEKYPNDDFANDAKLAVMNLGKSPEALIREFEERNRADSIRTADSLAKINKSRRN